MPRIRIPADWQRCILILLGDPDNSTFPARIIPVNASALDFTKASTLVYNHSDATIGGKFGADRIVLKPGKAVRFNAPAQDFCSYPVEIDCIPKGTTTARAVCRSMWQHNPDARQILFVVPKKRQPIPRVWGIFDYQWDKATCARGLKHSENLSEISAKNETRGERIR